MYIVNVNAEKVMGKIKPVHGIENAPVVHGSSGQLRLWKKAGFPFARLHDADYPRGPVVDIPRIFPNFEADENDPKNYSFENTDQVIEGIKECGAEIIYRLGTSIEHTRKKIDTIVPPDMEKWARIALNIIRHYNEGWANGYHFNIKYWEIWNEPNLTQDDMWQGTRDDYFRMYETTSKMIKKEFPDLYVGGPTLAEAIEYEENSLKTDYVDETYARAFLEFVKKTNSPLDFFSWHLYRRYVWCYDEVCRFVRRILDEYGFNNTISICDEWNVKSVNNEFDFSSGTYHSEVAQHQWVEDMKSELGASFVAGVMATFQKGPVDIAAHYDSNPYEFFTSVFEKSGFPTKSYSSFLCFNKLYKLGTEIESLCEGENIYAVAAKNENKLSVFISNYEGKADDIKIEFTGLPEGRKEYTVVRTDKFYNHTLDEEGELKGSAWEGSVIGNSTLLVTVTWKI